MKCSFAAIILAITVSANTYGQIPGPDFFLPDFPNPDFFDPDFLTPVSPTPDFPLPNFPIPDIPVPDFPIPDIPVPDVPVPDFPLPDFPLPDFPIPNVPVPDFPIPDLPIPDFDFWPLPSNLTVTSISDGGCRAGRPVINVVVRNEGSGWATAYVDLFVGLPSPPAIGTYGPYFQRVTLGAGESRMMSFTLGPEHEGISGWIDVLIDTDQWVSETDESDNHLDRYMAIPSC